ncbi:MULTISPECIES: hypothetical protein [unclassified Moorena]|nr:MULTISPECIES: hypothetical protein [unclassified Moorena]
MQLMGHYNGFEIVSIQLKRYAHATRTANGLTPSVEACATISF